MEERYTGYKTYQLYDAAIASIYSGETSTYTTDLKENEYLNLQDMAGKNLDQFCFQDGSLRRVKYPVIENQYCASIKPRNTEQLLAIDLLQDKRSKVKLIQGVYGSGKDYLMLNQALAMIENNKFDKIVFIRPNVTVADVPEIGYLKGGLEEKLGWTLGPLYDKVGGQEGVRYLIDKGALEMVPLLFIRGRSFENSIIYVTEGQNITPEIAKLIISRVGEGSELWINADNHQTDRRIYDNNNGIDKMVERLAGNKLFGYVYLPKTERGAVADLANLLD